MTSHIALLVNPASGRRRAAVTAVRLKEALREAGARVHVYTGKSAADSRRMARLARSEEHTSELQSRFDLVCRLLLEKKKKNTQKKQHIKNTMSKYYTKTMYQ